jgi:uncharacterized protein YndB with AHSA1/START domain
MATATITPDQDAIRAEIFVEASPERVFEAITDPSQVPLWWGQTGMYRTTEWHSDLRPGGKWASVGVAVDGSAFRVEGEYLEVDRPRLLVHTWNASWAKELRTTVRWELEPQSVHRLRRNAPTKVGTGTLVKLRHYGFAGDAKSAAGHADGWKRVFTWMKAYVESGETVDTRQQAAATK